MSLLHRNIWHSPSLRIYAAGLVILVLVAVSLFSWVVTHRVALLEGVAAQRNQSHAEDEIERALVDVWAQSQSQARSFAQWDETTQQFGNPTYYEYWRERRVHQTRMAPGFFDDIELYDRDGMPLGGVSRGQMPVKVSGGKEYWVLQSANTEGHGHLYHVFPVMLDETTLRGYIVLELDLNEAISDVQRFRYIDGASVRVEGSSGPMAGVQGLKPYIKYRLAPAWEFAQLQEILLGALWQFAILATLLLLLSVYLLFSLGSMPLARLSRHIDDLGHGISDHLQVEHAWQLPLAEFDKVRYSLDDYHARLHEGARALRDSEARMRAVLHNVVDGILTFSADGLIASVNPAVERMFAFSSDDLIGHPMAMLFEDIGPGEISRLIAGLESEDEALACVRRELTGRRSDGIHFPLEFTLSTLHLPDTSSFIAVVQDISERKEAEQRLLYLANFDALTGLPNRALLKDRLEHAMLQADRTECLVGLLFLDLDRFKTINDSLGHHAGDLLLRVVAERLKTCIRQGDTVARLGGDEFVVVVEGIGHVDDATRVAKKIREALREPVSLVGRDVFVTPSIGITFFPLDDSDSDALLRNADTAMYRSKAEGGDSIRFFTKDLNDLASERLSLETALRQALGRNEFELHYQPRIDVCTGTVVSVEALLRWNHPELGQVSPDRFIPILEEIGQIDAVGEWVLRQSCRQAMDWQGAGLPALRMAVNISAIQFRDQTLLHQVNAALEATGLAAASLELEITESVMVENIEATASILRELHKLGVHIALDDFGTGYSALSYLRHFHIDTLKIDRSFISEVPDNQDDARLASALVAIARSLGLRVTAEGVETRAQLEFLSGLGCQEVQGFFYSRALPPKAFENWLATAPVQSSFAFFGASSS